MVAIGGQGVRDGVTLARDERLAATLPVEVALGSAPAVPAPPSWTTSGTAIGAEPSRGTAKLEPGCGLLE